MKHAASKKTRIHTRLAETKPSLDPMPDHMRDHAAHVPLYRPSYPGYVVGRKIPRRAAQA